MTNTGQAASGAVSVALSGTDASAFAIDGTTCGAVLLGGGSCTVAVQFKPGSTGTLTASLSAAATPGGTVATSLQGEGQATAALSIDPASHNFGQTTLGVATATSAFTVTNTGQASSGTVAVALTGTDASYFSIKSSTCGAVLAPGDSCTVTVGFLSDFSGTDTASLTATATPGGSASASLTAQAIVPAYFTLTTPASFGAAMVGQSTAAQTITVTNEGQQTSGTLSTTLSGADPGDFVIDSNTCTGTLAGGASCSAVVHFTPTALGGRTATLEIAAFPGNPETVTLNGTGVTTLTVTPASYTFPNQDEGTTSGTTGFVLTNYGTTVLQPGQFTHSDTTGFPVTGNTCQSALNPGSSCTITVDFAPVGTAQYSSTMTQSFTDGQNTYQATFTASGTGIVPPPDLSTTMTVTSENYTNATVAITVTNLGSANSVPATMTIDVDLVQDFSYEAGAGTDCTGQFVNAYDSVLTCPVPVIAPGATYTRTLTEQNLSSQAPMYIQNTATTIMPGDTNSSNNTGYAFVTFG